LQIRATDPSRTRRTAGNQPTARRPRLIVPALLLAFPLALCLPACAGQNAAAAPAQPASPRPPAPAKTPTVEPCHIKQDGLALVYAGAAGAMAADPDHPLLDRGLGPPPCPPLAPLIDWYARFLNGPQVKPMTPKEKAWLAVRNMIDPFNALTILGEAGISVAANSHSPYGPGMSGWGRYVGVSYTQDMTGEFFGTFLIPSLVRQDPHYHRMPDASIPRRALHTIVQVVWTRGDNGHRMLNYADLLGFAADDAVSNLYVPGQQTHFSASASRYGITLATAPIDNIITEFLPDVARRIHIRVVLVQRIIDQVARTGNQSQ
jgi:hypothetical protein